YSYDGSLCRSNQGIMEFVEMFKAPEHEPGVFPRFLGSIGANTIITGGMGQRAIDLFKNQNIEVILGAAGNIKEVLDVFLNGDLYSHGTPCTHEHGEGDHHHHHHN
ncbi:MAG: hypothetical protein MJH09_08660, partial [Cetobacterium sp.]|nr:hypothetical protein [Cetobacterium sp.]